MPKEIHKRMTGCMATAVRPIPQWRNGQVNLSVGAARLMMTHGPADVITKEMVASVETLIMNDRRIKIDDIA